MATVADGGLTGPPILRGSRCQETLRQGPGLGRPALPFLGPMGLAQQRWKPRRGGGARLPGCGAISREPEGRGSRGRFGGSGQK